MNTFATKVLVSTLAAAAIVVGVIGTANANDYYDDSQYWNDIQRQTYEAYRNAMEHASDRWEDFRERAKATHDLLRGNLDRSMDQINRGFDYIGGSGSRGQQ